MSISQVTIELSKLEQLVNKVADMVITNSMMTQSIENMKEGDEKKDLQEKTSLFERHIKELQDYAMDIRMVKMETIFTSYPKIVEEKAEELGKKVQLKTYGGDTKIDKSMIESLSDPLVHLIENAVVHGIETPSQRVENGKEEVGTIQITAGQASGQVALTISNDGLSIDLDRIANQALEKGKVTVEELENMNDEEKTSLMIHHSSMSEIKEAVEKLNGSIQVKSDSSSMGIAITLFIPLTLAIMDGLNIRIGEDIFIIPTGSIVESLQPTLDMIKNVGDGSSELLMLREDFIPIVRLNDYLNVVSDTKKLEEGMLIVVQAGTEKAALFIDEFLQQQQIVVKPIDANYKKTTGISGATVKGDGSIGIILDIKTMVEDIKQHTGV